MNKHNNVPLTSSATVISSATSSCFCSVFDFLFRRDDRVGVGGTGCGVLPLLERVDLHPAKEKNL